MALYPVRKFNHYDWSFDPKNPVDDDHPMVALRPDLFQTRTDDPDD